MEKVIGNSKRKKIIKFFKNKYIFALTIFSIYALFLDDDDIFKLISQNAKLNKIKKEQVIVEKKYNDVTKVLDQMHHYSAVEKYAREEKLFKKDDEDIFIISYE